MKTVEIQLARQAVVDRRCNVVAYELQIVRSAEQVANMEGGGADALNVISRAVNSSEIETLLDGKKAFIKFEPALLRDDVIRLLPQDRTVFEIDRSIEADDDLKAVLRVMHSEGYRFALDAYLYRPELEPLLEFVEMVMLDVLVLDRTVLVEQVDFMRNRDIGLVAKNIETENSLEFCRSLGFKLFRGCFISRPFTVAQVELPPGKQQSIEVKSAALNDVASEKSNYHGISVLLVEDNDVNQDMAFEMFGLWSIEPRLACNGLEAVELYKSNEFDLVFMDCQMPIIDGYEATRQIREFEQLARLDRTPVIALTANTIRKDRKLCSEAGMDDHIAKPISLDSLECCLRRWLPDKLFMTDISMSEDNDVYGKGVHVNEHIDLKTYADLFGRLGDRMHVIVDKFIDNAGHLIGEIESSIRTGDVGSVVIKAQILRGSSLAVAATRLSELSSKLEQQARNNNPAGMDDLMQKAKAEYRYVKENFIRITANEKKIAC